MKTKLIIIAMAVVLSRAGISQNNIEFKEGPEIKAVGLGDIFGENENAFYSFAGDYKFRVAKFNKKTLANDYAVDGDIREEKDYFYGGSCNITPILSGDDVLIVYDLWNKDKTRRLWVKTINKSGKIAAERKELASCENDVNHFLYEVSVLKEKGKFAATEMIKGSKTLFVFDTKTQKQFS